MKVLHDFSFVITYYIKLTVRYLRVFKGRFFYSYDKDKRLVTIELYILQNYRASSILTGPK